MGCIRTFFNTVFIGSAAILWLGMSALVIAPFLWLKGAQSGPLARRFVYWQSRGIVFFMSLAGRRLKVEKTKRPMGSCIVVANHASTLDLYTIGAFGFNNVIYITKGWVFKLPFFSFVMNRAGYIDAEKITPQELLDYCKKRTQEGCDIVFFPQGSRKNPLARFKSGAFYVAQALNLPVVSVAIVGTQHMLPAGTFWIKPATLILKMFEPLWPQNYAGELGHLHMAQEAKKQIMGFVNNQ